MSTKTDFVWWVIDRDGFKYTYIKTNYNACICVQSKYTQHTDSKHTTYLKMEDAPNSMFFPAEALI